MSRMPASTASRRDVHVGESEDLRLMDPRGAVKVAAENPEHVIGIKVRVGRHASGDQGVAPLDIRLAGRR